MSTNIDDLTDAELADLIEAAREALARRQSVEAVRIQMGDAIKQARDTGVLTAPEPGAEYAPPGDATELCIKGGTRTVGGETWLLERGACVGPPSVANGWARVDDVSDGEGETDGLV